jgi:plasmid stabilization system protein ParE
MELKFDPAALLDMDEIAEWYESQSPGKGSEFKSYCDQALQDILDFPLAWAKAGTRARRYLTTKFPYEIYYSVDEKMVLIVAVSHVSRRPGHWRSRLRH